MKKYFLFITVSLGIIFIASCSSAKTPQAETKGSNLSGVTNTEAPQSTYGMSSSFGKVNNTKDGASISTGSILNEGTGSQVNDTPKQSTPPTTKANGFEETVKQNTQSVTIITPRPVKGNSMTVSELKAKWEKELGTKLTKQAEKDIEQNPNYVPAGTPKIN